MTLYMRPADLAGNNYNTDHDIDDGADHWQRLGPIVRQIVARLNVPTPTAIVIAEAAGYRVEAD